MVVTSTRRFTLAATLGLGLILAAALATAADQPGPQPVSALEFRLDGNFTLTHLAGTTVSWRHFRSETTSWRLGVTPYYERNDASASSYDSISRNRSLTVEWQWLRGFATRSRARPYWGLGVLAGVEHIEREQAESSGYQFESESLTYRAGVLATIGAEFVIADRVTLGAEYASTLTWVQRHDQGVDMYYSPDLWGYDHRSTSYALQTRAVALTVGILF